MQIHGLWENNLWISKPEEIKKHFFNHFKNLFSKDHNIINCDLGSLNPNILREEDSVCIFGLFSDNEMVNALSELGLKKALGPDGLNGMFIKAT